VLCCGCHAVQTKAITARFREKAMNYKKLAFVSLCAFAMPLIGLYTNTYVFIDGFPYGGCYHTVILFGTKTFQLLLIACSLGLLLGLIAPKISIWYGSKTRKTVLIVYGFLLIVAFAVRSETHYLSRYVFLSEQKSVLKAYESLKPGMTTEELVMRVKQLDANVIYQFGDTSPYKEIEGFPVTSVKPTIVFKYPGFYPKFDVQGQLVLEMSAIPSSPNAISLRVFALEGATMLASNPAVIPGESKIYRGHVVSGPDFDTFLPCGAALSYKLKISDPRYIKAGTEPVGEKTYMVFRGALDNNPSIHKDSPTSGVLEVFEVSKLASRRNYSGDILMTTSADGVQKPWDCVYN
jgi:hypothetical protein